MEQLKSQIFSKLHSLAQLKNNSDFCRLETQCLTKIYCSISKACESLVLPVMPCFCCDFACTVQQTTSLTSHTLSHSQAHILSLSFVFIVEFAPKGSLFGDKGG